LGKDFDDDASAYISGGDCPACGPRGEHSLTTLAMADYLLANGTLLWDGSGRPIKGG
jgi:hypothetical protein